MTRPPREQPTAGTNQPQTVSFYGSEKGQQVTL
jgi:hypothetical protein